MQTHGLANIQTDRQAGRQTDIQIMIETSRHTGMRAYSRHADR